jgi:hypothetical protein
MLLLRTELITKLEELKDHSLGSSLQLNSGRQYRLEVSFLFFFSSNLFLLFCD